LCDAALCFFLTEGSNKDKACEIHCHDEETCFGSGFKDHQVLNKKAKMAWVEPAQRTTSCVLAVKKSLGLQLHLMISLRLFHLTISLYLCVQSGLHCHQQV
jgi:hypothetical protein